MKKLLIIVFMLLAIQGYSCSAEQFEYSLTERTDIYGELGDALDIDRVKNSIPESAREFIYDLQLEAADPLSLDKLLSEQGGSYIIDYLLSKVTAPVKQAALLVSAILLCALIQSVFPEHGTGTMSVLNIVAALCCALCVIAPVTELFMQCCQLLSGCCTFMLALIPVFAGILIASAKLKTALGFQTPVFIAIQAVSMLASYIVMPFSSMYLAIGVSAACSGENRLLGIAEIVKKTAIWIMSVSMTVYISVFSIKNIISCALDGAGGRAARVLVSSVIPIVGVSINEALSSMKACVGILKNSIGIYVIVVMLVMLVPAILQLVFWKLTVMLCGNGAKMLCVESIAGLLEAVGSTISIMLSVMICSGVMLVFSVTVITLAGGSL